MFKFQNQEIKCPASGCGKRLKKGDLQTDKALAKRVKAWQRRNERDADRDDAEEIID
jgi:hypothetical protein